MSGSCHRVPVATVRLPTWEQVGPFLSEEFPLGFLLLGFGIKGVRKMPRTEPSIVLLQVFDSWLLPTFTALIPPSLLLPLTNPPPPISRAEPVPLLTILSEGKQNRPHALWGWHVLTADSFPGGSSQAIFESFHLRPP